MRLLALCLIAVGLLGEAGVPQKNQTTPADQLAYDEPYNIAEVLRLPAKTPIVWQPHLLPKQPTYRLFLGTRLDFAFAEEVKLWLSRWNKKHEQNAGQLQIVTEISHADVLLVKFQNPRETVEETVVTGATLTPHMRVGTETTTQKYSPQYAYLLVPKDDGYAVIWRQHRLVPKAKPKPRQEAKVMLKAFTERLKKR